VAVPAYKHFSPPPAPKPVFVDDITIIKNIKTVALLTTAIAEGKTRVTERVLTDDTTDTKADGWWDDLKKSFQHAVYRDRLTLQAEGDAMGGFDLRKQGAVSVTATKTRVIVTIGAPEILFTRLDNDPKKTKTVARELGGLNFADNTSLLEAAARYNAEQRIKEEACDKGILEKANLGGKLFFSDYTKNLLRASGDTREVEVHVTPRQC
jgi:hypothetical protein